MYKVMWWDAYGDAHISEIMLEADAEIFAGSMFPEQEAYLVYVTK